MLNMPYSIVIEATNDPEFFGFHSPELKGFSGVGHSIEDCLYKAKHGFADHVQTLKEQGLPVPPTNPDPMVTVQNERKRHVA
jgi:predicted RNase H-like HicB family nuclease